MSNQHKATVEKLNAVIRANDLEAFLSFYFCDVYRFRGDKIAELTAFLVKTEP